jgi:hypothetical protein
MISKTLHQSGGMVHGFHPPLFKAFSALRQG